jgi:hypothetical protein
MTALLSPHVILLVFWLIVIVIAAFLMRMACSLCQADIPTWRRAIISVVVVTFLAYLTFDFTAYMILRSIQDVVIQVPPGYGYNHWFREAIGFKWEVISHAGPLRYLPPIFALCVAGILEVVVLQAEVTFRWGLVIFLLHSGATLAAAYVLSLVFGVALDAVGWTAQPVNVAPSSGEVQGQGGPKDAPGPGAKKQDKFASKQGPTSHKGPGGGAMAASTSLQTPEQHSDGAVDKQLASAKDVLHNLKNYANSHLEEVKEELAPVTRYLPQPVHDFLDAGGWWLLFGIIGLIALLWLRSIVRKLRGALTWPRKKRKKHRTKKIAINLKIKLAKIGEAVTEEGPKVVTVNSMPARLRLVVMSVGSRNSGELHEEMADRVLDWIKPGLAQVSARDYPAVHVWPPFLSSSGFAQAVRANVIFPELAGEKSPWALVVGQVKMGQAVINVALGLYAEEPNTMRVLKVSGTQWLSVVGVQESSEAALSR